LAINVNIGRVIMKIILGIAIMFVMYEIGYSIGYGHCADNIETIIDAYNKEKGDDSNE